MNTFAAVKVPARFTPTIPQILTAGLLLAGIGLWLANLLPGRGLFLDEANLALNLGERDIRGFFRPLDHQQYAPPLLMVLSKVLAELFSYGELTLRLLPFLGGLLTIWGLFQITQHFNIGYWRLLPVALLFANPLVLQYVTEFKPYALDMGLAAVVMARVLSSPQPQWWWAPVGAVYCWLSIPAVFVLAAMGMYLFVQLWPDRRKMFRWGWIVSCWVASFGFYYFFILQSDAAKPDLLGFHRPYFFPFRWWELGEIQRGFHLVYQHFSQVAGYTVFAVVMGMLAVILGCRRLIRQRDHRWILFLSPLLIAFLVSAAEKYSLIPRMMLFALPGLLVLIGIGSAGVVERIRLPNRRLGTGALALAWLLVLGSTNVLRHYWDPLTFSQLREMSREFSETTPVYVAKAAIPGIQYYRKYHPTKERLARSALYLDAGNDGLHNLYHLPHFMAVYDHLAMPALREQVFRDIQALRRAGYEVERHDFYRGALLEAKKKE